ncbi:hypothetical protein [Pendulispora albinea]|uniref:Uncharacterized protein n=1 Tax=Pendulispora albinea TaxID=2741071 RepID=A0ABZ2MCB3_9BACT
MIAARACSSALGLVLALLSLPVAAQSRGGNPSVPPSGKPSPSSAPDGDTPGSDPAGDDKSGKANDDDAKAPKVRTPPRGEPQVATPADPLEINPEIKERIGSDSDRDPPAATGEVQRKFFPYYEERKGDLRIRLVPPLYLEHTRGLPDLSKPGQPGASGAEDRESLIGLLYYQRRSPRIDADVLFPLVWRVRERQNNVFVLGPLAHREAPGEHDNWLAPLFFQGSRPKAGYFHAPLLLTTSHYNEDGAFTLVGPFFRDRTKTDVDMGLVPFFFHGDNGSIDGMRKTYTLIPPLLFYNRYREVEQSHFTVAGPLILQSDPKRSVFDIAPLFFHIQGRPESGGIREHHTTLLPLFHYGRSETESLFVVPGYLRRVTLTADTMLTPFYSVATTRNNATRFQAAGPVLPLFFDYRDRDIGLHAWAMAPFYYQSDSPRGHDFLTPLFGKFETYGQSRTWWAFPTLTVSTDQHGWEADLHPILYFGRNDRSTHSVVAPFFWDFASPKGRTTVGFPLYWRFADTSDDSVVQVAANTLYMQKKAVGGTDWQFHLLPLFSYGEDPTGYFWNILFGLAGYQRSGSYARVRAFWIPIQVAGPSPSSPNQTARVNF